MAAFLPGQSLRPFVLLLLVLFGTAAVANASGTAGPTLAQRPAITGQTTQGARLTASPGTWDGSGTVKVTYRWYRCDTMGGGCAALRGATGTHHVLSAADVGHTIGLVVRAGDSTGSRNGYASLVGPVAPKVSHLRSIVQPAISGAAVLGGSLHVDTGTWTPTPASFDFQWIRCNSNGRACAPIPDANTDGHVIVQHDVAHALVAIVQAKSDTAVRAVLSGSTAAVTGSAEPAATGPVLTAPPTTSAVAQEGEQLTGLPGTWNGKGTIRYEYQWYRCDPSGAHCKSIHGAVKATYKEVAKDVGQTLGLTVRASDDNGTSTAYASLLGPVAVANADLASTAQPSLSGTAQPGQTVQVTSGSWNQAPTSLGYQWQRCNVNGRLCSAIPGATDTTYLVTSADTGHALVAVVQATAGAATQSAWSIASAPVGTLASGPAASLAPTVTGALRTGVQLEGATGTWSGSGPIRFSYQWYRCDAAGAHCASVHGATKSTYTQVAKDVGQTIGFAVRATDLNGTTIAYAALVGPVAAADAALISTSQPTLSGTPTPGQTLEVTAGSWSKAPSALAYQWQRCNANGRACAPIDGATGTSYTVSGADSGHAVVAVVKATAGSASQSAFSTALVVH